ncbi:MAG TPA: hypothetical protein VM537_26515 [Anaerolineae bacterium]|nr:hypothetical protein [Anaerolineae bacterium]
MRPPRKRAPGGEAPWPPSDMVEEWNVICLDNRVLVVQGPPTEGAELLAGPFDTEKQAQAYADEYYRSGEC